MVLDSVLLDAFPHLFDAEVELVLRLLFLVDKVVSVVGRLVRLAARLRRGCCGDGRWGGSGRERQDARVGVEVVHFGGGFEVVEKVRLFKLFKVYRRV